MSFDLAVWESTQSLFPEEGLKIYEEIIDDDTSSLKPSEKLKNMIEELNRKYPNLDDCSDDEIDKRPWTCGFAPCLEYQIFNIAWPRVEDVAPEVVRLAEKYGLQCFDPQAICFRTGVYKNKKQSRKMKEMKYLKDLENSIRPYLPVSAPLSILMLWLGLSEAKKWPLTAEWIFISGGLIFVLSLFLLVGVVWDSLRNRFKKIIKLF